MAFPPEAAQVDDFAAFDHSGVPEWWRGAPKDPIWWRHRPLHVRTALLRGEVEAVQGHLEHLVAAVARVPADAAGSEGAPRGPAKEVAPGC